MGYNVSRNRYIIQTAVALSILINVLILAPVKAQTADTTIQKIKKISLDEALRIADKNNYQVRTAAHDVDIMRAQYRETNAVFLPQVTLQETAVATNDPLNAFGFKLKEQVVTAADFNPVLLNNPGRTHNYNTKIEVRQPVLNMDGFLSRNAMKNQVNASKQALKRTREYARYQVKKAFNNLILTESRVGVLDSSLTTAETNRKQAESFYKQGMINKADLLAARVHVLQLRSELSAAKNQLEDAGSQLRYLLGMEDETIRLTPVGTLSEKAKPTSDYSMSWVNNNRSDMKALKYQIKASRDMLSASQFHFVPSFNVFGSYEWNDKNLLGLNARSYMVGASLKWNLFKGFQNAGAVEKSHAQLRKVQLMYEDKSQKNSMEIASAYRAIRQSKEQIELGKSAVKQAAENLRIRTNRYQKGLEKTTDVLMAETALSQAKLNHLMALYQYNMSIYTLDLLLGKDHSNQPVTVN